MTNLNLGVPVQASALRHTSTGIQAYDDTGKSIQLTGTVTGQQPSWNETTGTWEVVTPSSNVSFVIVTANPNNQVTASDGKLTWFWTYSGTLVEAHVETAGGEYSYPKIVVNRVNKTVTVTFDEIMTGSTILANTYITYITEVK